MQMGNALAERQASLAGAAMVNIVID